MRMEARALSLGGKPAQKRRVRNGEATNDLILSAHVDGNDRLFQRILVLYVKLGSVIADVTYGKGVFWRRIPTDAYYLRATDIQDGVDCRSLPYEDGEIDCVVLDPPYMHEPGGTAHEVHAPFEEHYRNNGSGFRTERKYDEAVLDLYRDAGREAHRVLRDSAVLIVKCPHLRCARTAKGSRTSKSCGSYDRNGLCRRGPIRCRRKQPPWCKPHRAPKSTPVWQTIRTLLMFWKRGESKGLWELPQ